MHGTPYDPTWLVDLARASRPGEPWLAEALARCTRVVEESRAYLRFAGPDDDGPDARFEKNLVLHHAREGELVLDVLAGGRIGGIEFLKRL
jgi:hypothetical protein